MNRRGFLKNSIGALFCVAIEHNKILCDIVNKIPKKSMDVLLYSVQTKWGDWKIKATKWTNIGKEKLNYSEFNTDTFTVLGIFDNSEIKEKQTFYSKKYKAVNSLYSVDHYQCTINGINYPVTKQATTKSRSKGGNTRVKQNKESGYWNEITKKYSSENGKKNIMFTKTKYAILAQKNSATWSFSQIKDGKTIKVWIGSSSFKNSLYTFNSVRMACYTGKEYKGYNWKIKRSTNKKHRSSKWNIKSIKEVAKKCKSKAEFKKIYQQAYSLSKRLGIYEKITKHMKRPIAHNKGKEMSIEQKIKISNTLKSKK
jgi:hypothetical protein